MGQRASRCALRQPNPLPPVAAACLADNLGSTCAIKSGATALPWQPASPQEQLEWRSICSEGGQLLKAFFAACLESTLCGEGLGRLFVSEIGLFFEGVSGSTGLLRWKDLSISRLHGRDLEIVLSGEGNRLGQSDTLRLQLVLEAHCAGVYECWMLSPDVHSDHFHSFFEEEGQSENNEEHCNAGQEDCVFDPLQPLTDSFIEAASRMPSPRRSLTKAPLYTATLPGLTLDAVKSLLLREQWVLSQAFQDAQGAYDLSSTKFSDCARFPGTQLRRISCTCPIPDDVPEWVLKMVNSPLEVSLSTQCSVTCDDDEVILLWDSYTRGAMFSERFYVHNYNSFKSRPEGGVEYTFFAEPIWLSSVWFPIKKIIEAQAKKRAKLMAQGFSQILRDGDAIVGPF